jgi:hypothetical protein
MEARVYASRGTGSGDDRLGPVRSVAVVLALCFLAACGATPTPTTHVDPPIPTPTAFAPLPAELSGIPAAGAPTAELQPHSPRDELEIGEERDFTLGHCGLGSPIDIDGSLWDPSGGQNGAGGALNEAQSGELINATSTVIKLESEDRMVMRTPLGAVIVLTRHDGPRDYFLCD